MIQLYYWSGKTACFLASPCPNQTSRTSLTWRRFVGVPNVLLIFKKVCLLEDMARKAGNGKRKNQKKAGICSSPVDADGAADSASNGATFEAWLDGAGIEWRECCRLEEAASGGQGVFAVRDIAAGETVLAVPDDAVLMPDDCCIAKVTPGSAGTCRTFV